MNLLVVCHCNRLFSRIILSSKNSTVWAAIWATKEKSKQISGRSCIKVKFLQFFIIIFIFLITFSLVSLTDKQSASKKKLAKTKRLNYYLNIIAHFDIAKYSKIVRHILESIKLKKKNRNKRKQERKCKKVLNNSLFLVTRPGSAV